jgi:hypothetical protein
VASAKIVGPAPERQIPRRPGWVVGVRVDRILGRPGIWLLASARAERGHELRLELAGYLYAGTGNYSES